MRVKLGKFKWEICSLRHFSSPMKQSYIVPLDFPRFPGLSNNFLLHVMSFSHYSRFMLSRGKNVAVVPSIVCAKKEKKIRGKTSRLLYVTDKLAAASAYTEVKMRSDSSFLIPWIKHYPLYFTFHRSFHPGRVEGY